MKNNDEILSIVNQIKYKDGWIIVLNNGEANLEPERPYIQIVFNGKDSTTGKYEMQRSRKWYLSYHMTTSEIVYTTFKAIEAAEDHEMREFFKYKNVRVVNPHFSVDDIVELVNENKITEDARVAS